MYVWFVVPLCQVVRGYTFVWPVIRGVTLSDYLPPKGRDHSHVESGKHIYVCMVYCCGCLFVVFFCISLLLCVWMGEYISTQTLVIHHWAGPSVIAHLAPDSTPDRAE